MKINDIIVEISSENLKKLNRLRDLGKTELATRINHHLGRVDDWDAASEAARDDMDAGRPVPKSKDRTSDKKIFRVDTPAADKSTAPAADVARARGWDDDTHGHLRGDGTGTGSKIMKALNPLSDLDSTDLGTTFTSALSKAKSKAKNFDKFKIKR